MMQGAKRLSTAGNDPVNENFYSLGYDESAEERNNQQQQSIFYNWD